MDINCSCIKGVLDFSICHLDCTKLVFCDLSDWMEESYYSIPSTYPAEITHPLGGKTTINFTPGQCTVLTAQQFSGTSNIQDGVYCITVDNCGTVYTKSFALLPNMKERIAKLYLEDEEDNGDTLDKLERYQKYIEVNAMFDKKDIAKDYFEMSSKILDGIDCKKC